MNECHSVNGDNYVELTEETRAKRKAILDAARAIIARQGYEETTIAQIASAAGVAVGTVYLYFRNKRDIYTALSLEWVSAIAEVIQDPRILDLPIEQNSARDDRSVISYLP